MNKKQFDSTEEYWIYLYLSELKEAGYIKSFECQPEPFKLFEGLPKKFFKEIQLKTKISKRYSKRQHLINPHHYTADFKMVWKISKNTKQIVQSVNLFSVDLNIPFLGKADLDILNKEHLANSYLEVKGSFDRHNATRLFTSRTQPWVWQKFGIYVQLIKPLHLFKETFIPKAIINDFYYKKSGKWGLRGDKKYEWEYKTLNEYTNGK